jgi:hypothetical protein
MTTDIALIGLIGIFIIGAVLKNYYPLWFLAGVTSWALGVWWVYNPLIVGGSPMNDIALTIAFFGGFILMVMMNWRTNKDGNGGFVFRMPKILGGQSEDEEKATLRRMSVKDRRVAYSERLNRAIGRRK